MANQDPTENLNMEDSIQVAIGLTTVDGWLGMQYHLFDEGVYISSGRHPEDLTEAIAVLRDLADALEAKLRQMTN